LDGGVDLDEISKLSDELIPQKLILDEAFAVVVKLDACGNSWFSLDD
jgi:hypothetical protein